MNENIKQIKYDGFTVYEHDNSHSFVYANFDDETKFMSGLAKYIFRENNLLNYANSMTKFDI